MLFFLKGLVLGFLIAVPVGPMGVLCIRRTLVNGMKSGLASGFGTATADAVYGCIAALGITAAGVLLADYQSLLRLGGGLFLLYLGWRILQARPAELICAASHGKLVSDYASAFALTLTNPMTIIMFAVAFAGLGIGGSGDYRMALVMVAGVFAGSSLWWLILAAAANCLRAKLAVARLCMLNRFSGCLIIGFGILSILSVWIAV